MAMDNKQKTMLGVLAVLVLGMGGYWYTSLSGDSTNNATADRGPRTVRVREKPAAKNKRKKSKRVKRAGPAATTARRERDTTERKSSNAKRKRKGRGSKVKKKKIIPAA